MGIARSILDELVIAINGIIERGVKSIILYGSAARGTADEYSDVDIALIVEREMTAEENDRLCDVIVDMNLKYGKVFSVIDISGAEFEKWRDVIPFYRNVANEGVVLWKAA